MCIWIKLNVKSQILLHNFSGFIMICQKSRQQRIINSCQNELIKIIMNIMFYNINVAFLLNHNVMTCPLH